MPDRENLRGNYQKGGSRRIFKNRYNELRTVQVYGEMSYLQREDYEN
jgi:hypothetical protein